MSWNYYPDLLATPVPRYTSYPTAAEFGEAVGAVRVRGAVWPHFVQHDIDASISDLPRGFRTGESAADDVHDAGLICLRNCHGSQLEPLTP